MIRKVALGALFAIGLTGASQAAVVVAEDCENGSVDPSGRVSGSIDCQFADVANNANGVYDDLFFDGGFSEIERDTPTFNGSGVLTGGGTASGNYNISASLLAMYDSFVIVFKQGSQNSFAPAETVAYLLAPGTLSGTFLNPFAKSVGNGCDGTSYDRTKNNGQIEIGGCTADGLSHVTLLGKSIDADVPLPAGLPLILTALGLTGFVARRKSA